MSLIDFNIDIYASEIDDEEARRKDRRKAYNLFAQAIVLGAILTAAQYALSILQG